MAQLHHEGRICSVDPSYNDGFIVTNSAPPPNTGLQMNFGFQTSLYVCHAFPRQRRHTTCGCPPVKHVTQGGTIICAVSQV